jgi:hypothetical protein
VNVSFVANGKNMLRETWGENEGKSEKDKKQKKGPE